MSEISRLIRDSGKYPEVKWIQLQKVSKLIVDDAKKKLNTNDFTDAVETKSRELAKNPGPYIDIVKAAVCTIPNKSKKMAGGYNDNWEHTDEWGFTQEDIDEWVDIENKSTRYRNNKYRLIY
jgi:hypothetical protein